MTLRLPSGRALEPANGALEGQFPARWIPRPSPLAIRGEGNAKHPTMAPDQPSRGYRTALRLGFQMLGGDSDQNDRDLLDSLNLADRDDLARLMGRQF